MRERASARFVPRRSVTVAFEGPAPTSYGVVANISQGGACVWTDAGLEADQLLTLSLSFAREGLPVPAEGRVVWTGPAGGAPGRRYGIAWAGMEGRPEAARLRELIAASG